MRLILNTAKLSRKIKDILLPLFRFALFSFKQNEFPKECIDITDVSINTSTNNTLVAYYNNTKLFIRPIMVHKSYREQLVEGAKYYYYFCNSEDDFSLCVLNRAISDIKTHYKTIIKLPDIWKKYDAELRSHVFSDYDIVGFPSLKGYLDEYHFYTFLKFIRGVVYSYLVNKNVHKGRYESFNSNLQIATCRMADLLQLKRLIPDTCLMRVKYNDFVFEATVMKESKGVRPSLFPLENRLNVKQQFIEDISSLEILDSICYQLDHRLSNYNVYVDEHGYFSSVSAFDNDCPMTFFPVLSVPQKVYLNKKYKPVVYKGRFNRPYIENALKEQIESITFSELFHQLIDYLNVFQIIAVYRRIKILKRSFKGVDIIYKIENDKDICKIINETNEGKYSGSYLWYFLNIDESANFRNKNLRT